MKLDADFVVLNDCAGRGWQTPLRRRFLDLVCRLTGHLLWRTGAVRDDPQGSLQVRATYCRRCFKGGYVRGDYVLPTTSHADRVRELHAR